MITESIGPKALEERIRHAVARLMAMQDDFDGIRISVPVIYPSGAMSVVEVSVNNDKCFISDMGVGYTEAMLSNAEEFFKTQAKRAAERFGIGFDGQSIFVLWASIDQMETAIASVANASVQAASLAILKASEDRDVRKNDELYERIRSIFQGSEVQRAADLKGKNVVWHAHNVVVLPAGRVAVFEFVSVHTNSIANKFMMFSDLSMSGRDTSLNAVVKSVETIVLKGSMLADVSNVISLTAPKADFIKYARLAA